MDRLTIRDYSKDAMNRPRLQRAAALAAALMSVMTLSTSTATSASAASTNCGTVGNYFDGIYFEPATVGHNTRGVIAQLLVRPSASCTTDGTDFNFTNAWTMIAGNQPLQHVQSGFVRRTPTSFTQSFSQAARSANDVETTYVNTQLFEGARLPYEQQVRTSTLCQGGAARCVFSYSNGSATLISNWDPLTSWNGPFEVQYAGETGYRESDIPGRSTNRTEFTGMKYYTGEGGTGVVTQPCGATAVINSTRWGQDRPACDQMRVWTATG